MARSDYYVDPSGGNDTTGDGSSGTPWATVQKALNTITRNATDGDRINVKAGGTDTLSSALTLATYGTPAVGAPLVIQGYTSAAGDGGRGTISGGGSVGIFTAAYSHVHIIDMHLTNCGAATILNMSANCVILRCEIDTTSTIGFDPGNTCTIAGCYVHDCGTYGIAAGARGLTVFGNYLANGTTDFSYAIQTSEGAAVVNNVIVVDGSSGGINTIGANYALINNTVYGGSSTGTGILLSNELPGMLFNNIVTDFSGAGGIGISIGANAMLGVGLLNNAVYNCTTAYDNTAGVWLAENNATLGASPFVNAATGDFDINGTVTDVTEAAWPQTWPGLTTSTTPKPDVGAVQAGAGAGGASIYRRVARILGG